MCCILVMIVWTSWWRYPPPPLLMMFYWPPEKHFPAINESKVTLKHYDALCFIVLSPYMKFHWNKSLKNTLCQVWLKLKLVKWFWRRKCLCQCWCSPSDKFQKSSLQPSAQVSEKYIKRLYILSDLTFVIRTCVIWKFFILDRILAEDISFKRGVCTYTCAIHLLIKWIDHTLFWKNWQTSITYPTTTQEMVVPINAKAMMEPKFLKKCLWKRRMMWFYLICWTYLNISETNIVSV